MQKRAPKGGSAEGNAAESGLRQPLLPRKDFVESVEKSLAESEAAIEEAPMTLKIRGG